MSEQPKDSDVCAKCGKTFKEHYHFDSMDRNRPHGWSPRTCPTSNQFEESTFTPVAAAGEDKAPAHHSKLEFVKHWLAEIEKNGRLQTLANMYDQFNSTGLAQQLAEAKQRGDNHFKAWEIKDTKCKELQAQFDKAQSTAVNLEKQLAEAKKLIASTAQAIRNQSLEDNLPATLSDLDLFTTKYPI